MLLFYALAQLKSGRRAPQPPASLTQETVDDLLSTNQGRHSKFIRTAKA